MQDLNDLKKIRVLVIEDDRTAQLVVKSMLKEMPEIGFAHVAANGIEALAARDNTPDDFDVFFIDLGLPDISGIRATELVREFEQKNSLTPIPICALTAHNNEKARQDCFNAGMNAFINKPTSVDSLRGALRLMGLIDKEAEEKTGTT